MKIAVPSNDNKTVSAHFGRTKGFVFFEIENNEILKKSYKENKCTGHAKHEVHEHGSHEHSHVGIFQALGDCKVVIAGGMGKRLYNDFQKEKIEVFVTKEKNIDKAIELFLSKKLDNNSHICCSH
ncbi:MAG: iron-molybdenum cofactor biosynthesis protein [Bacteroidetes bacterium 4572_128]|nr:MAG: iron-molybdenum cofactor biosynthesis protein [Bacteroidetes bacterium 4572_128]